MPIRDIQQAWREIGRIRIGDRGDAGDGTPRKLLTFRLTSSSEQALLAAAGQYGGGHPEPWRSPAGPAFQLTTESATLDVVLPPGDIFSQWWERWTAAGCDRRCDGETETRRGAPCVCPEDLGERAAAAKEGDACRPITRLAVIIPNLPDLGIWRLETHSLIAARELAATMAAVQTATSRGIYVPGRLRLEQRRSRRPGERPHDYGIPVLELPELRPDRLLAGQGQPAALLEAAPDEDTPAELAELEERPVAHDVATTAGRDPGATDRAAHALWQAAADGEQMSATAATEDQADRIYDAATEALQDPDATDVAPRSSATADDVRPEHLDPDSPEFLGPEPEWLTEHRPIEQPATRAEAERGHTSAPDPGGPREQNPETAPAPPAQPAPADLPTTAPPRVDPRNEVPPDDEAAQLITALYTTAAEKGRSPDEVDRYLVIESGLNADPSLEDVAELVGQATRRGYGRVAYRFRVGDYDMTALERATRKAAKAQAERADRQASWDGDKVERRSGEYSEPITLETYTQAATETPPEESPA